MRAAWEARRERLPRDHGHLAMMDASMAYLRQFVPDVLAAVRFDGGPGMDELLQAVTILAGLYATRARKVPDGAPGGFVPARWAGYLEKAAKDGDVTAYRHYWELCVLMALRDGLRSGDVYVPGSRRYADPASFLLTPQQWEPQRAEFCHVVGRPASAAGALALANDELHAALSDLETQLARGGGPGEIRLGADGELVVPPLTAEDVPAEAGALRAELGAMLPRVPIASVLVEVDARTGFTDHLVHAGGKVARPPDLKRNLLYVIIAEATNIGLGAMAESCGVPYDVLAWTAEWYFRGETLEAANAAIVNYHHRLPMTQAFGTGTLSSSDGQRFPVKGKSLTARHLSRYFARGQGISTLHSRLGPALDVRHQGDRGDRPGKPLRARRHPGQPDRPAHHRARHRHPRRDAGELRAVRPRRPSTVPPHPRSGQDHPVPDRAEGRVRGPLPVRREVAHRRFNEDLVTGQWDELLRVAASVKGGHATAALVVGKLCSSRRQQNALASAIKEYGALRRTVYAARYLADETYRRRIGRQLNKGENLHALKRSLAYADAGALRRRHHEQQAEQMWCLTLATNAVVTWTTEYHGLAMTALRRAGRDIDNAVLAHIWPTHHENVHFYGTHSVDVDGELAKLDSDGYRPLRAVAATEQAR